jgi:DNA-binding NarL/FixJ family response regulator
MRLILADDSMLFREGLARVLSEDGLEVVGQARTPTELMELVAAAAPDMAIVDIRMPPTHTTEGLDAALRLRGDRPGLGVLLLSQYVQFHHFQQLFGNGERAALGYLLKDRVSDLSAFRAAVRTVGGGGLVIDPEIASRLLTRQRRRDSVDGLTDRERVVLGMMAEGRSNLAIGDRLRLSQKTVEAHVHNIFAKLGLEPASDDHRRVLAVLAYLRS